MGPHITRTLTGSPFDHIAIILRFGDYIKDLYVLEAVGDKGVRIVSWYNLRCELYEDGFFDKLVTRKLLYDMTAEKLTDLDVFRRNTVGKRYGPGMDLAPYTAKLAQSAQAAQALAKAAAASAAKL